MQTTTFVLVISQNTLYFGNSNCDEKHCTFGCLSSLFSANIFSIFLALETPHDTAKEILIDDNHSV